VAYPIPIRFAGGVFHITVRGNNRQRIFRDEIDYEFLLSTLGRVVPKRQWQPPARDVPLCRPEPRAGWAAGSATAGLAAPPRFLHLGWLLDQFSPNRKRAQELYREFVAEGAPARSLRGLLAA
jgi:hypothetical protein